MEFGAVVCSYYIGSGRQFYHKLECVSFGNVFKTDSGTDISENQTSIAGFIGLLIDNFNIHRAGKQDEIFQLTLRIVRCAKVHLKSEIGIVTAGKSRIGAEFLERKAHCILTVRNPM